MRFNPLVIFCGLIGLATLWGYGISSALGVSPAAGCATGLGGFGILIVCYVVFRAIDKDAE